MAGKNIDVALSTKRQLQSADATEETTIPTVMLSLTDVTALSDSLAYIVKKVSEYISEKKSSKLKNNEADDNSDIYRNIYIPKIRIQIESRPFVLDSVDMGHSTFPKVHNIV